MSNNISFTIPLEASIIRHTITMLESALADIENAPVLTEVVEPECTLAGEPDVEVIPPTDLAGEVVYIDPEPELDPKVIFGTPPVDIPTPIKDVLDDLQCPWDERINVSSRTQRKSDNTWTLLRNIDPALVEQVRAEIRQGGITPPPTADAFTDALSKVTTWLTSPQGPGFKVKMDMLLPSHGLESFAGLMSKQELIPVVMPLLEAEWNTLL